MPRTGIRRSANGLRSIRVGPSTSTPTSASWLNAVEGFFAKLTNRRLKRGVFRSVAELQVAIDRFIAETNADPKPFVWIAPPSRILAAVKRGKQTLESLHSRPQCMTTPLRGERFFAAPSKGMRCVYRVVGNFLIVNFESKKCHI